METIEKLSKEKLPMITVLAGEDLGQYSQAKEKFLKQIGFDPSDLTYSYFDMSETDYQDAELDIESMPFFADEKVVIFSQWERMTRLIAKELDVLGVRYEYLHGGIPSEARKNLTDNFTELPESRVFLSTDAGSTGLNLQVASILINLDLPWNPAVLEQRIARIYRIGQKKNIQVINLVASQTIEERMLSTLNFKTSLFEGILDNGEDTIFLENSKFDKMMDSLKVVAEPSEEVDGAHNRMAGCSIDLNDNEEKVVEETAVLQTTDTDSLALLEEETPEEGVTEAKCLRLP